MSAEIRHGDALAVLASLPAASAQTCITSPPYWGLRDYGSPGELGGEATPEEFVSRLVRIMEQVRRVLVDDGTLWLNLGDSYAGSGGFSPGSPANRKRANGDSEAWGRFNPASTSAMASKKSARKIPDGCKPKDLVGIPWMVAFSMRRAGWYLRSEIIWVKGLSGPGSEFWTGAVQPEAANDRPTRSHEHVFLFSPSRRYFCDMSRIREGRTNNNPDGRNPRTAWGVPKSAESVGHPAAFPEDLVRPMILSSTDRGQTVLDPFAGSGTTGIVAVQEGRNFVGIEISPEYAETARQHLAGARAQPRLDFG